MAGTPKPGRCALRRGRYSQPNRIYLVTFTTDQRIPWFRDLWLARIMCRNLEHTNCLLDAQNLCWVVMPDHVHVLLGLRMAGLEAILKRLKSRTAVLLNRKIGRTGRFWEPGYHDHALRKEENIVATARYIVANPLRAGLVKNVREYPFWNAVWL